MVLEITNGPEIEPTDEELAQIESELDNLILEDEEC